jgi:hypothetical protein
LDEHFGIPPESIWDCASQQIARPLPLPFDSLIISNFPKIFTEFQKKDFEILWRGSRDGFTVREFHRRCDGHANTLTVILDTEANIFGGFTPLEWDSRGSFKTDDSLKGFLFTLKNPHNVPARRFALKTEKKYRAIWCDANWGPCFDDDLALLDDCNANSKSYTYCFGWTYMNDTGIGGDPGKSMFLTGATYFRVKEIEVFEIKN